MSLQDALDVFFQKEEIDYRCEKCGHLKAEVSHKFAKLPRLAVDDTDSKTCMNHFRVGCFVSCSVGIETPSHPEFFLCGHLNYTFALRYSYFKKYVIKFNFPSSHQFWCWWTIVFVSKSEYLLVKVKCQCAGFVIKEPASVGNGRVGWSVNLKIHLVLETPAGCSSWVTIVLDFWRQ